jgi:hypothetical protein
MAVACICAEVSDAGLVGPLEMIKTDTLVASLEDELRHQARWQAAVCTHPALEYTTS